MRLARLAEHWMVGQLLRCRLFVLGFIPIGVRALWFEKLDPQAREIHRSSSLPPLIAASGVAGAKSPAYANH
jgi:hypothetical protein